MCVCEDNLIDWGEVEGVGTFNGGVPVAVLLALVYKKGALLEGMLGVARCVILNVGPEFDVHIYMVLDPAAVSHRSYHV